MKKLKLPITILATLLGILFVVLLVFLLYMAGTTRLFSISWSPSFWFSSDPGTEIVVCTNRTMWFGERRTINRKCRLLSVEDYERLTKLVSEETVSSATAVEDRNGFDGTYCWLRVYDENNVLVAKAGGYMVYDGTFLTLRSSVMEILDPYLE